LKLKKDPKNANKGTSRGKWAVNESIRSHGAGRSILANKNGVVIAGNKTRDAAQDAGLPIKEIHTAGEELVVVVRVTWTSRRTRKPANSRMRITAPPSWD
jgi:hypothetical protein